MAYKPSILTGKRGKKLIKLHCLNVGKIQGVEGDWKSELKGKVILRLFWLEVGINWCLTGLNTPLEIKLKKQKIFVELKLDPNPID